MIVDKGYSIEIEVLKAEGKCAAGHKVGDKFFIDGAQVRFDCGGLYIHALYSMLPKIFAMRYETQFPQTRNLNIGTHTHLYATNPHVFGLPRLPRQAVKAGRPSCVY